LLARTKHAQFHGYNVCREFGEAIGMMLENWCWLKDELIAMSCHYTHVDPKHLKAWQKANPGSTIPPKTIPEDLLEPLIQQRPVFRLVRTLSILLVPLTFMDIDVDHII
jgi:metallopeptidase MepB